MRVLLTGSSGFLGRHILAYPAAGVHFIRVTRAAAVRSEQDVALGPGPWGQREFERALSVSRADVVIHCAGVGHTNDSRQLFEANTLVAAGLLAALSAMAKPPRAIFVGSAAEYGFVDARAMPIREDHPCQPRTEYGISKYTQTLLAMAAAERGLPVMTARVFNAVGLGMPAGLALPSFARRIATVSTSDGVLNVGDVEVRRDFIDATDVARILLALSHAPVWPWPVVNLCSGQAISLGRLLDSMISVSGRALRVKIDPALTRVHDRPVVVGSTERLAALDLSPATPDFDRLLPLLLEEARQSNPLPWRDQGDCLQGDEWPGP
jgi:nucleoside-diphosphate-sugar epimerase